GFSLICWIFALLCSLLMLPGVEAFAFALSVIFLSFSFLGATAAGARAGRIELPRSKLLLIGFLFSALALASVAWSDLKFESYLYFWFLFALPLSALVFLFNPDKEIFSK